MVNFIYDVTHIFYKSIVQQYCMCKKTLFFDGRTLKGKREDNVIKF